MNDLMTALWETAKEPLRYLVLAIIPVLLTYFGTLDAQWAVILVLILRLLDKFLHEWGKIIDDKGTTLGLARF